MPSTVSSTVVWSHKIVPISQRRKPRHRVLSHFAQSHKNKYKVQQGLNPGLSQSRTWKNWRWSSEMSSFKAGDQLPSENPRLLFRRNIRNECLGPRDPHKEMRRPKCCWHCWVIFREKNWKNLYFLLGNWVHINFSNLAIMSLNLPLNMIFQ